MRTPPLLFFVVLCALAVPSATLQRKLPSGESSRVRTRRAFFPRPDPGKDDVVTLTEQHSTELLLKHGALQRHGAAQNKMQSITLALRGETGEIVATAAEDKLGESKVLCTVPKRMRDKPLKALAVAHSLIYSLDLLEHLAEVTRTSDIDISGGVSTLGEVVVLGFTALSRCLIPVLNELGFEVNVVVPSEGEAKMARSLGATSTLLRNEESFSDAYPNAVAYIDAISRQSSGSLAAPLRGRYFSVMPVRVSEALDSGALKGFSLGLRPNVFGFPRQKLEADSSSRASWTPRPEVAGRLAQALDALGKAPSGELQRMMYHVEPEVASWTDYGQALTWPRDPDTGMPFGFAVSIAETTKVSEGWGVEDEHEAEEMVSHRHVYLLNEVADQLLRTGQELYEEDRNLQKQVDEELMQGAAMGAEIAETLATATPTEVLDATAVQRVDTLDEALSLIGSTNMASVLLIGGKWCRACKYASAQVRRVASKYPNVQFFEYRASDKGEPLRSKFGIAAVPTLLLNRDGKTIHHSSSCSDTKAIAEDVESWLM